MCRLRNIAMCDYQESVTTGQTQKGVQTDGQTDAGQSDPYVPLCFAGDTITETADKSVFNTFVCLLWKVGDWYKSRSRTFFLIVDPGRDFFSNEFGSVIRTQSQCPNSICFSQKGAKYSQLATDCRSENLKYKN